MRANKTNNFTCEPVIVVIKIIKRNVKDIVRLMDVENIYTGGG